MRRLYVHEAVAMSNSGEDPMLIDRPGRVVAVDNPQDVRAVSQPRQVVDQHRSAEMIVDDGLKQPLMLWSGTLANEMFERHPMTFLRPGHEMLAGRCEEYERELKGTKRRILVRPHARHVLSDPQSALSFAREHEGGRWGLAFSPADLLEAGMLDRLEEHLTRAFEALGPICELLLLGNVRFGADDEPVPTALGEGVLREEMLRPLLEAHVPEATPVVVAEKDAARARAWLEGSTV